MAKTKATGGTRLGRDSLPKYLGIKLFDGEPAKIGSVIVRQRGSKFLPGKNVKMGGDYTLYSIKKGVVRFATKRKKGFNNVRREVKVVSVSPR